MTAVKRANRCATVAFRCDDDDDDERGTGGEGRGRRPNARGGLNLK
jgi:hypothetical protein